jgi:hypothetical protein
MHHQTTSSGYLPLAQALLLATLLYLRACYCWAASVREQHQHVAWLGADASLAWKDAHQLPWPHAARPTDLADQPSQHPVPCDSYAWQMPCQHHLHRQQG